MRDATWGIILVKAKSFRFINCSFESLTVGGVNVYKECSATQFVTCYSENTPSSDSGSDYGMFYINHDGTTLSGFNRVIVQGGIFGGHSDTHYGSFLDVDELTSTISIVNASIHDYVNGIKADTENTDDYSIYLAGNVLSDVTNDYVDTTGKLDTTPTRGQIKFPATQIPSANVNTLDDYEEGEFTPIITFGDASVDMTYAVQFGLYTKIGRMVVIVGRIELSAKGTSEGSAAIGELPFVNKNVVNNRPAVALIFLNISFADAFQGYVKENTRLLILSETTNAGVRTLLDDTNFADNSTISFQATYFTD